MNEFIWGACLDACPPLSQNTPRWKTALEALLQHYHPSDIVLWLSILHRNKHGIGLSSFDSSHSYLLGIIKNSRQDEANEQAAESMKLPLNFTIL